MPIVPTYQRQVSPAPLPNVRMTANADPNAYGANVGQAIGQLGEGIDKQAKKIQAEKDIQDTVTAETGFRKELGDLSSGYLKKYQKDARDITPQFDAEAEKIRQKYESTLTNSQTKLAFNQSVGSHYFSSRERIIGHEATQLHQATLADFNANLELNRSDAAKDPSEANVVRLANETIGKINFLGRQLGSSEASLNYTKQVEVGKTVDAAITSLLDRPNPDHISAQSLLNKTKDSLHGETVTAFQKRIDASSRDDIVVKAINDIKANPDMKNSDGTYNLEKVLAGVEEKAGQTSKKTVPVTGKGALDWNAIKTSGEKELGKPYELGGPGATGDTTDCGQFTRDTFQRVGIDLGTRGADGQYRNLEVKGATFTDKSQLKQGDLVFFSGTSSRWEPSDDPAAVNDSSKAYKGITHVGIYAGDGKVLQAGSAGVGYKEIDSIGTVVGYGKPASNAPTTQTVSAYDPVIYKRLVEAAHSAVSESQAIRSQSVKNGMNTLDNWIVSNKPTSVSEIEQAAKSAGFTGADLLQAVAHGKQAAGLFKVETNEESLWNAYEDVKSGKIGNDAELKLKYGDSVSVGHLMTLANFLTSTQNKEARIPPELQNKDNLEAFDGAINEAGIKQTFGNEYMTKKSKILEKVTAQVRSAKEKGVTVTRADIEQWTREQASSAILAKKGIFSSDVTGIVGDVPNSPGWGIDGISVYYRDPQTGQEIRPTDYRDGKYYTEINGQEVEMRPR